MDVSDPLSPLIPPNQHPLYLALILTTVALLTYTQTFRNPQTPLHAITTTILRTTAIRLVPLPTVALLILSLFNAPLHTATFIPLSAFLTSVVAAYNSSDTGLYNLALRLATPLPRVLLPPAALPTLLNRLSTDSIQLFHGYRVPLFTAFAVHNTNPPVLWSHSNILLPGDTVSVIVTERTHHPQPYPRFGFLSHRSPNPGAEAVLSLKACLRIDNLSRPSDDVTEMWEWAYATGFASLKESHLPDIAVELARREGEDADDVLSRAVALGGIGDTYNTPTKNVLRLAVEANLIAVLGIALLRGIGNNVEEKLKRLEKGVLDTLVDTGGFCVTHGRQKVVIAVPFEDWPAARIADVVVEWVCVASGMPVIGSEEDGDSDVE